MPDNILVVEYEPRAADRVRQALEGRGLKAVVAKDAEEALRLVEAEAPRLVLLPSVIPKGSPAELIRSIRQRKPLDNIPVLLTVSGYTGHSTKADAARVGANDLLPKPFSDQDLLQKVQQMIGNEPATPSPQLTSDEIFGDLVADGTVDVPPAAKRPAPARQDIDKLLADRLGGVAAKKTTSTSPGTTPRPVTSPGQLATPRPKTHAGTTDIDKMLQDTLSGLEKKKSAPGTGSLPPRAAAPAPSSGSQPDRVHISPPVFPPSAPMSEPASREEEETGDGVRFGPYVLLEKIASGGMAEVWKARKRGEEGFQKVVAIKKILPHLSDNSEFIEMFIDEAKLAAQLNHSNIVHIYDLGKIGNSYYIAMEYVDGHDLKSILKRGQEREQPLGPELALFVASKIAAALDYAHRKRDFDEKEMGLVHRDVSPQNVLISEEGDIKLCDFGIAKAASKASHTQAGALKGKLQYMSPEQAWGKPIDRRSDIFALGAVLFEMLTHRKLFGGDNEMSVLEQVRQATITPPSHINDEISPEIDAVVIKALEKEPSARYQTAGEMAKDLDSILYTFRPTPTSADLAIFMDRLLTPAPVIMPPEPPTVVTEIPAPVAAPAAPAPLATPAPPAGVPMPAWDAPAPRKRSLALPIAFVALLIVGVAGAFLYLRSTDATAPASATTPPQVAVLQTSEPPPPAPQTATLVPLPTDTTAMTTVAPTTTAAPVLDPSLVDLEVQRRLAAERARLEQESLARQQAAQAVLTPRTPAPQPAPQPVQAPPTVPAPQPQTPAPVQTATAAPPPAPVVPDPAPPTPQPEPAPAVQRLREGDLAPAGTEGLVPARIIRRATVPYPPLARTQRIEGTVICSVLVSETGSVIDVRVIRGINRPVGLNEAAVQMMRRSTFTAPTVNGTRVKAWTTVPVEFRL